MDAIRELVGRSLSRGLAVDDIRVLIRTLYRRIDAVQSHLTSLVPNSPAWNTDCADVDAAARAIITGTSRAIGDMDRSRVMETEGPWTDAMAAVALASPLFVILEGVAYPSPWKLDTSAVHIEDVRDQCWVVHASPVSSYSAGDVLRAIDQISRRWARSHQSPDTTRYLAALIHRACVIIGGPASEKVHDTESMRTGARCGNVDVYTASSAFVRRVAGAPMHWLFFSRIPESFELTPASLFARNAGCTAGNEVTTYVRRLRQYMAREGRVVAGTRKTRKEAFSGLDRLLLTQADYDRYREANRDKRGRPAIVHIATATSDGAMVLTSMKRVVFIDKLVSTLAEEDEDYDRKYSATMHAMGIMAKLYMFEIPFRRAGLAFVPEFVRWEEEAPGLLGSRECPLHPMVFFFANRAHIYYRRRVILCGALEHALVLWCVTVRTFLGGIVLGKRYDIPINVILSEPLSGEVGAVEDGAVVVRGNVVE